MEFGSREHLAALRELERGAATVRSTLAARAVVDVTPPWGPGLGPVDGMAAHPSMQVCSTLELEARLRRRRSARARIAASFEESATREELLASTDVSIAAHERAIGWRRGRSS